MRQEHEAASSACRWEHSLQETQQCFARREWGKVVVAADQGLSCRPEREAEARFRFYAGSALLHVGDLFRAEQELARFCRLAERSQALQRLEADAFSTLARLMQLLDRYNQEAAYWRKAIAGFEAQGRMAQALACRQSLAWSLALAGHMPEALLELEAVAAGAAAHGYPELQIDHAITTALFHSMEGKTETADGLCLNLMHRPDLTDGQSADLAWILGCNALARGEREQAAVYAAQAESAAVRHWWPPQLYRVQTLQARIKQGEGQEVLPS